MDNTSFFWANFGVLEKIGAWSPFYRQNETDGTKIKIYNIYRTLLISFCSIHTFCELYMITFCVKELDIDELTVSIAYSIQHFLGIVKVYIMISRQDDFLELDRRTKEKPLYRRNNARFIDAITEMVKISDKLGYVYWFAVLVTITCGGTTGVFMTLKNKHEMTMVCQQKYELYETYLLSTDASAATAATTTIMDVSTMTNAKWDTEATNGSRASSLIGIDAMRKNDDGAAGINELVTRVNHIEKMLETLNITIPDDAVGNLKCVRPKKVFPYHIWLPFDGKNSKYFEVIFVLNWLAGFTLVCCILPIDLLCMSFLRYIRFQFEVIKDDLLNLRQNAESDLKRINGIGEAEIADNENTLSVHINNRLMGIVNHQLAIFDFFTKTDDLFTWVLLAQYLASGVMICGVLFSISSVADDMMTPKFFHVAFFYSGLLIQLYSNCFYGNEVLFLSGNIREYAYFSNWQKSGRFTHKIKVALTMTMCRSLRACRLTAGKFAAVDLPTFLAVFKASYTYYTVLIDDDPRKAH